MRAFLDPYAFSVAPQAPRPSVRDANSFSRMIPEQADTPAPAPAPAPASASSTDGTSTDTTNGNADNQDTTNQDPANKPVAVDPSVQWINAQLMAFKIKGTEQTTNPDGTVSTNYTTQLYFGTKPPTTPDELAKGLTPPGTVVSDPSKTPITDGSKPVVDPNVIPVTSTPPTVIDPTVKPTDGTDPSVKPTDGTDPSTIVATKPVDPTPADPTSVDPATVVTNDPGLVTQVLPKEPVTDPAPIDPNSTDGTVTATTDPSGMTPSDVGPTTTLGVRAAHAGHESGANRGGSGPDDHASDPAATASPSPAQPSVTVASMDTSLVVPADKQLAPSLGRELVSTAQGMTALERVLQATDQSQTAPAMLKTLNVQLSPADLGNVSVSLSLQGSALDLHLSVDQGKTRDLIERDRHVISDSLSQVGYSVGTLTVEQTSSTGSSNMSSAGQSFSSNTSQDGSSGRQYSGSGSGQSPGNGRGSAWRDPEAIPVPASGRPLRGQGVFI